MNCFIEFDLPIILIQLTAWICLILIIIGLVGSINIIIKRLSKKNYKSKRIWFIFLVIGLAGVVIYYILAISMINPYQELNPCSTKRMQVEELSDIL